MRFLIIDLVPALLSWRGEEDDPDVAEGAVETLEQLHTQFRLAGITDGDRPGSVIRSALRQAGIGDFFDTVGTSADFGPSVSPQVIQRIATTVGAASTSIVVVTARHRLADALGRRAIATVLLGPAGFAGLPDQLRMGAGPLNP